MTEQTAKSDSSVPEQRERFGMARLYRDAASMASSSVINAIFGVIFWGVAARLIAPHDLGVMTAVLAALTAPAAVVAAGVGDAYTALLPAVGDARPVIFKRGQRIFLLTAAITGVIAGTVTIAYIPALHGSLAVAGMVAAGTIVFAGFSLQNSTLVAIGRARWLVAVTAFSNALKIALLITLTLTFAWHPVELSATLSALVLLIVLTPRILSIIKTSDGLSTFSALNHAEASKEFNRFVVRTYTAVALSMGVFALTPFLVTAFAGPKQGAVFALALIVTQTLDFINAALGSSLVVHASSAAQDAGTMARSILVRAMLFAVVASVLIVGAGPYALHLLNSQYDISEVRRVLIALCVGSIVRTFYMTWAAIRRSRREMRALLILNAIAAATLLLIMPAACEHFGAVGAASTLALAQSVLGLGSIVHFLRYRRAVTPPVEVGPRII